ncbi:hypothetical protein M3M39_04995 [Fructilactobacillus hinvesii]|uniref:Uncharacterized protein n=1 Tax=Fructilactobacillus hinvesii TaxID=2940300 RepID=A0ABY5BT44_9LACO|nr:hypothetical protein [Fructilactobacillus hinvesii]USS87481.1 hypothetical protein M3M39_04995 [Fructilactobacillus hinvesii]
MTVREKIEQDGLILTKLETPCIFMGVHLEKGDYIILKGRFSEFTTAGRCNYADDFCGYIRKEDIDKPIGKVIRKD